LAGKGCDDLSIAAVEGGGGEARGLAAVTVAVT